MANSNSKNQVKKVMTEDEIISSLRVSTLFLTALLFVSFFFGFCYVFNTDYGVEVGVNGWNLICMSFYWNFKSSAVVFGDIAVPFYVYAKYYTIILTVFMTIVFYFNFIIFILSLINIKKQKYLLSKISMILSIFTTILLLGCFIVALTMNGSRILPKYCSGNPACSIHSLAIFPFFISLINMIASAVLLYKLHEKEIGAW